MSDMSSETDIAKFGSRLTFMASHLAFGLSCGALASLVIGGPHVFPQSVSIGLLVGGLVAGCLLLFVALQPDHPTDPAAVPRPISSIVTDKQCAQADAEGRLALARVTDVVFDYHSESTGPRYKVSYVVSPRDGTPYATTESVAIDPVLAKTVEVDAIVVVAMELTVGGHVGLVRAPDEYWKTLAATDTTVRTTQPMPPQPRPATPTLLTRRLIFATAAPLLLGAAVATLPLLLRFAA
ncbi:hypothetical protein ACHIPZ_16570 [Antrihabitans sp. NCIMB 15449]|uniref:DUF3592 domain-containing protein n=1 Tax=Antrihabitans spumae TaxID=3373370 RepID=A0ABW7JP68_9NOCA